MLHSIQISPVIALRLLPYFSFLNKKGALHIRETLEEAVEIAQRDHDVEFRTKLWVAESFARKAGETSGETYSPICIRLPRVG